MLTADNEDDEGNEGKKRDLLDHVTRGGGWEEAGKDESGIRVAAKRAVVRLLAPVGGPNRALAACLTC